MKASLSALPISAQRLPLVAIHGAEFTAPAAGTILADTGALAAGQAGTYLALCDVALTDTAANLIQLAHRNAANGADIELADGTSGILVGGPGGDTTIAAIFTLAVGERVVVRNKNAGTAALFYQADLYLFPIP